MSDSRPIGVFDSGIGGLTVVKALRELLPNENIFYLGDTARVPYGNKSAETVERYALELAKILIAENAKLIVVACNTVSSVAIPKLRANISVPVIGVIEPGANAAIAMTRNRHVGVVGTRATIRSGAYENALRALNVHVRVTSVACPLLVPLIEEGLLDDKLTDLTIERYLNPMASEGIDTLVLGCTHYPLLTRAIARSLGDKIQIVDSAMNCAKAVKDLLDRQSLAATSATGGRLDIALTDAADHFLSIARDALQLQIGDVQLRAVGSARPDHTNDRSSCAVQPLECRSRSRPCSNAFCSCDNRGEPVRSDRVVQGPDRVRISNSPSPALHRPTSRRTFCHQL